MSKGHYSSDTTAEYNGDARVIGGGNSLLMFTGTEPGEQTAASLTPTLLTLAAGLAEIGGKIKVQPEGVTLSVGEGTPLEASVTLAPGQVKLQAGQATLQLSGIEGITLSFPGATVQLQPGGQITIQAVQMGTTATNYQLSATALTESVAGSAQRSASATMIT
ncbi:MAG: hypothetical protein U0840_02450 [Gemmataceae bacterium]